MKAKRFRLTKAAKILIFILIVALVGGGIFGLTKSGLIKPSKDKENPSTVAEKEDPTAAAGKIDTSDKSINLSLDEWVGWGEILIANGGLKTTPDSIYGKMGLDVNIKIVNDAAQSSNALIKGDLNAAGYTINRTAFLSQKFMESGVDIIMPYVTNYSHGGDGIIASNKYQTIDSLVDAKIGVPQFSEAHSMIVWFVNQSDLSEEEKNKIIDNLIFFDTPDDAAKAFFSGQIDVAATWQPYLTQAENATDSHVMFSTANSTKLIMDGIVFRDDFAKANPETVSAFIDGALQAGELYGEEVTAMKEAMPMFSGMTDDEIREMCADAELASWNDNMEIMETDGPSVYADMCEVWSSVGETVDPELGEKLFDASYLEALADTYEGIEDTEETAVKVTEENQQEIIDAEALLTKSTSVNFVINTAKFTDTADASAKLDDFIKVAKTLDGTIIQIEGNTDPNPDTDPTDQANIMLSKQRAEAVKQYFITNGISADRIITVGNGSGKPVAPNDTEENKAKNRRTDVSFKIVE